MAQKVLILGDSGTGKSASLRNFKPEEILVINAAGKPLPFKNHFECVNPAYTTLTADVLKAMDSTKKKVIVIDDAQYIMSFQYMRRIKENGWDKWNDIQGDFFNIIHHCDQMPADVIVYFLSHLQRDDEGREKIKTMGKMLDEKITVEGLFTTVLKTSVQDGVYCFLTQNSGKDTVKSPIGMFDSYAIENDLKYVDTKIRNYYEIGEHATDAEVATMDEEKAVLAEKPERQRRRRTPEAEKPKAETPEEPKMAEPTATEEKPAEEMPKRKRREAQTEKAQTEKAPKVEESKAEAKEVESREAAEAPKRRRRKAQNVRDSFFNIPEGLDEELPFN